MIHRLVKRSPVSVIGYTPYIVSQNSVQYIHPYTYTYVYNNVYSVRRTPPYVHTRTRMYNDFPNPPFIVHTDHGMSYGIQVRSETLLRLQVQVYRILYSIQMLV